MSTDLHRLEAEIDSLRGRLAALTPRAQMHAEAERLARMGSWVWNIATDEVRWSEELFRMFGYDPATTAASPELFAARVHPDDLERMTEAAAQAVAHPSTRELECRIVPLDGTTRWMRMSASRAYEDGASTSWIVGSLLDVTEERLAAQERERTNELFAEAAQIANLGTIVVDLRTHTITLSREAYRIMGVPEDTPATMEMLEACLHPDDRERVAAHRDTVIAQGTASDVDARVVRPSGEIRHTRLKGLSRRLEDGRLELRAVWLDITEETLLQRRLAASERLEAVGRLAAGVAHDLGNHLMVIGSNLQLLDADPIAVGEIQLALEAATTLTRRLLAFGRQAPLRPEPTDLNAVVESTVRMLQQVLGARIQVQTRLAEDLSPVALDRHQASQALVNLLINARDAMPEGGEIVISTEGGGSPSRVRLTVEDDGPGIDPRVIDRVFEPYVTTKGDGDGTGLGLAMVHGIVMQHGGSIEAGSAPSGGARFVLDLPVAEAWEASEPEQRTAPVIDRRLTILIVDDQPAVTRVLARLLERVGHRTLTAEGPARALDLYAAHASEIDLVISDLVMPEMRGTTLVRELESRHGVPAVVFMSGYGAEAAREVDPRHVILKKPFVLSELLEALAKVTTRAPASRG